MPRKIVTNFGAEIAGTLTRRHDSSAGSEQGQNIVAQPVIGFAPGLAMRFGGDNRFSTELSPSLTAGGMTGDNRPAVCQPWCVGKGRETIIGQIGTTERLGNARRREVSFTLQTAGGDAMPTIIDRTVRAGKGGHR